MVLWIFGYGSLIWTPEFRYEERITGFVKDFKRVFAPANCVDHRRTGKDGGADLCLTLQPQEGAITGGVAYRVTADVEHQILSSYLEERLLTGSMSRVLMLDFFTGQETSDKIRVMTYISPPERSNLWHVVLQMNPAATTDDHSDRESARSHRAKTMMSKSKEQSYCARRVSTRDQWTRDRAWFESQHNRATC